MSRILVLNFQRFGFKVMGRVLVTGSSGFIGFHLVKRLIESGHQVQCLVRGSSNLDLLRPLDPQFVVGDITDRQSMQQAIDSVDVVYHLAGLTKSLRKEDFAKVNENGVRQVASACAASPAPPVLVIVSSLAAAGPAPNGRTRDEQDPVRPVSLYGQSKLAGERVAREFASRVPISIVRPPIVLGEGDRDGLAMFQSIANSGVHLVPSLSETRVSLIHAQDLAESLIRVAANGKRITADPNDSSGVYFSASSETPTYAELGQMIADAVGARSVLKLRVPGAGVWAVAAVTELIARVRRRPFILSLDKAREATAGSWTCSSEAIKRDTGAEPTHTLSQRLAQTARWYVEQGWLKVPPSRLGGRTPRRRYQGNRGGTCNDA